MQKLNPHKIWSQRDAFQDTIQEVQKIVKKIPPFHEHNTKQISLHIVALSVVVQY